MKKQIKKLLSAALSLTMVAGSIVLPTAASAAGETTELKSWKFDFGSADNTAEGYTAVPADKVYNSTDGYGFLGLENGFAIDNREDGWDMTQGYDLVLENGKRETVTTVDDDFVATTTRTEKEQDYNSPIRFSLRVDSNTYYKVKVTLQRADVSKEANVSLFTEKRHQHLLNETIPADGLVYETSVYVHNNWSKNTGEYVDKQLSIAAAGDNVAISSIEIEQTEQGKTFWILGDSTVCQQTAAIPYWPLDHCQGVGSAMAKYVSKDWAIVNEAESGLSASASTSHFNNMKNDIKPGDVVWFEFGHNDDKVTNDPSTNGYLSTLSSFYDTITAAGASLIVSSPIERNQAVQYVNGTWTQSLAHYGTAASAFVEEKIAAGKTNIAYIDLNTECLEFLNEVQAYSLALECHYDGSYENANKERVTVPDASNTRFYYYVSKYAGYVQDYTHPNDYGADNFASLAVNQAKEKITAAAESDTTDSQQKQAAVLSSIFADTRTVLPVTVSDDVYKAGAAPNNYYPTQLAKVVKYKNPIIVNNVAFEEETNKPATMQVKLVASDVQWEYGRGVIDIYDKEGTKKGTVKTTDVVDAVSSETQVLTFNTGDVVFDQAAGDTLKAYVIKIEQNEGGSGYIDTETVISTEYTQNDMIDVKEYLLQGAIGTENKEDFSTYDLAAGDTIIGKGGWKNPGGETFAYAEENGVTYAHCETTGSATYYPEKKFTAVSSGKLYCRMDVRYISGTFNLYFTDGTALNNWPAGRIMPVQITQSDGAVKVYLNGTAVATINSGEWVTFALTIDLDYGKYSLNLNGQTYTADFAAYQSTEAILTPSNLSLIAFQNDKSTNEYDVTNIVLATLNTEALPDKTLTVASEDSTKGSVSIVNGEETVEGTTLTTAMNTVVTAVAEAADGYAFKDWKNTETGEVVSYSISYALRLHNDVSLTAEFETAVYDPITYAYNEQFSTLSTSTLKNNGWVSPNAQELSTIESDATHGNYLKLAPGQNNDRNLKGTFPAVAQLTEDYVLEFDTAIVPGNNHATELVVFDTSATVSNNAAVTSNYILNLNNGAANSTKYTINGGSNTVTIPNGAWVHIFLKVKPSAGKVDVKITNGDTSLYSGTETINGTGILGGINLLAGRYQCVMSLDNIKVYTADQLPPDPVVIDEPTVDSGTVSLNVTNNTEEAINARLIVASYNDDDTLAGVTMSEATNVGAAEQAGVKDKGTTVTFTALVTTSKYKIMLWNSAEEMVPLMDAVDSPTATE